MSELILGLARHSETERVRPGGSPGTGLLFSTLEASLRPKCTLRLLPADFYGGATSQMVETAQDLLSNVDALVISIPPHPLDLEALFLVRRSLGRRVPFVYLPLGEFPRGAWYYRYLYQYFGSDDLIWFSSTADRAVYHQLVASSPAQIRVFPFGIDPAPFRRAAGRRSTTRCELGVADEEVVLVVHGRIDPEKNVHAATALLGQLVRRDPRCRLWLVGPSVAGDPPPPWPRPLSAAPSSAYRDMLVESLGGVGANRVYLWGNVPREQVARIVAAADIGLNLTVNRDENFGFSTVEAMAAGLPVIGTDWGGLKDTIEDGVTGYRIPTILTSVGVAVDNWAATRRALELISDGAARRRMGASALARVRELYRIESCTDNLLGLVRCLLDHTGPPRRHRWTRLGQRLAERYSVPVSGVRPGAFPVPIPPVPRRQDGPIVRAILRPYATYDQSNDPRPLGAFMLASRLLRCTQAGVTSCDSTYPLAIDFAGPHEALVCELLQAEEALTHNRLAALTQADPRELVAPLSRLLACGVVVQSWEPALEQTEENLHVGARNRRWP